MTDIIDFQFDINSEWTVEDSLALDAEILAAYGRRTATRSPDKWGRTIMRLAIQICIDRGMAEDRIVGHLKTSPHLIQRVLASTPELPTWVEPIPDPQNRIKPPVRPCTECEDPTRPSNSTVDQYPNTKVRSGKGMCSTCYSSSRRRARSS